MLNNETHSTSKNTLYVGDLDKNVTETDLYTTFGTYGAIRDIRLIKGPDDTAYGEKRPYAYIIFEENDHAERAMNELNYKKLKNSEMRIMPYKSNKIDKTSGANIWIKNIPEFCDSKMLYDSFSVFGEIMSCRIAKDPATGKNKGYAFVQFSKKSEAKRAIFIGKDIKMNDTCLIIKKYEPRDISKPKQTNNLYFKNVDTQKIDKYEELFKTCGEVLSVKFIKGPDGDHTGAGFVCYSTTEDADKAEKELDGRKLFDFPCEFYIKPFLSQNKRKEEMKKRFNELKVSESKMRRNLYITNIPLDIKEEDINKIFGEYGKIESATVKLSLPKETSKFAMVAFENPDEASEALEKMNGKKVGDNEITVTYFKSKKERDFEVDHSLLTGKTTKMSVPDVTPQKKENNAKMNSKRIETDIKNSLKSLSNILKENWEAANIKNETEFINVVSKEILELAKEEISECHEKGDKLLDKARDILKGLAKN